MRENSIGELIEKKRIQYSLMKSSHGGIYNDSRVQYLSDNVYGVLRRGTKIGQTIKKNWEHRPDSRDPVWMQIKNSMSANKIEPIRKVPSLLIEAQFAVAWDAFVKYMPEVPHEQTSLLRQALLREFFRLYIKEYKLHCLGKIPIIHNDLRVSNFSRMYNFQKIVKGFRSLYLDDLIFEANSERICILRLKSNFISFIDAVCQLEKYSKSDTDFSFHLRCSAEPVNFGWKKHKVERSSIISSKQESLLEELSDALGLVADNLSNKFAFHKRSYGLEKTGNVEGHNVMKKNRNKLDVPSSQKSAQPAEAPVVLFVALR